MNGQINKQISFMYSKEKKKLYMAINEGRWSIELSGKWESLTTNNKESILVSLGKRRVLLAILDSKN
jgi:hypothetical protein